ncbi:MAG: hypothetical protein ACI4RP_05160 [Acutalibacteraceae bacterium]
MVRFEVYNSRKLVICELIISLLLLILSIIGIVSVWNNAWFSSSALFSRSVGLLILSIAILELAFKGLRQKLKICSDRIIVQKTFSKLECRFSEITKIKTFTKNGAKKAKPKTEFTIYKDKYTYFDFDESMVNSEKLIDVLVRLGYILRMKDGSYESLRK